MSSNKILCITGMHRSGTSFITSWLSSMGMHVGHDLIPGDKSNIGGHFEDIDFVNYHKRAFVYSGYSYSPRTTDNLKLDNYLINKGIKIVELKSELNKEWAWKDPRSTIFLELYDNIIPNLKCLFIYRDPSEVVMSLIKRDFQRTIGIRSKIEFLSQIINYNVLYKTIDRYFEIWLLYNSKILEFIKNKGTGTYILVNYRDVLDVDNLIVEKIANNWGFCISQKNIQNLYVERSSPNGLWQYIQHKIKERELETVDNTYSALEYYRITNSCLKRS